MRSTGYPLYLTLGFVWSKIPLGDIGYRMNLLSAIFGALTIFLVERILRRWRLAGWAKFGALGLLATSTYFWGLSSVAEVYTLHTAIMAGFILALLWWSDSPTPRRMYIVGLMGGLGMSHHAAMVLLIPGGLFYILSTHPKKALKPRSLFAFSLAALVGLSFYLYLPLRYLANPAFNYAGIYDAGLNFHPVDLTTLEGLWWLFSGRVFIGRMMAYNGIGLWHEIQIYLTQLVHAFFDFGIGPGLLGMILLFRRKWREGGLLALMFLFNAGFYINYQVLDKDTMYLPTYLIWTLWLAYGLHELLEWIKQIDSVHIRARRLRISSILIITIVLFSMVWNWRLVDLSRDWSTRVLGEAILQKAERGAIVYGWWDTVPVIQYLQLVEGMRPDVKAINRFLISQNDLTRSIKKELRNRPIYIDSMIIELSSTMSTRSIGPILQLIPNKCLTMRCSNTPLQIPR
ncbi:MAG: hypothetical protein A2136_10645 [Chloroflexi bacterium RBG_16_54_11]|nr:MAG: hypothetical protein A2136_10645 [Chloroflexi bacterium RBG_16_54_11]